MRRSTLVATGLALLTALTLPAAAQMQRQCPAFSAPPGRGKSGG